MAFWWICAWIVLSSLILTLGKRLCLALAWRFIGWRPSILDKKLMEETTTKCCTQFEEGLAAHPESGWDEQSEEQKEIAREQMRYYTRFVIEEYVLKYSMAK